MEDKALLKTFDLSIDDQEALIDALDTPGYLILVNKILPALLVRRQERLLSQPILNQDDFVSLALKRAAFDGAQELMREIRDLKKAIKTF